MTLARPDAAIAIDEGRKRSEVYMYTSLVPELQYFFNSSYVLGCLVASQKDIYFCLGIQRVGTILHVGIN